MACAELTSNASCLHASTVYIKSIVGGTIKKCNSAGIQQSFELDVFKCERRTKYKVFTRKNGKAFVVSTNPMYEHKRLNGPSDSNHYHDTQTARIEINRCMSGCM